jgi:threonine dehydrogenase-like Zn-dependent dehydrogenase
MKSFRFTEFGPPSVLRIEEIPIPEPGEGEALVLVKAAGINPSDIGNVSGHFKKTTLPRTPAGTGTSICRMFQMSFSCRLFHISFGQVARRRRDERDSTGVS